VPIFTRRASAARAAQAAPPAPPHAGGYGYEIASPWASREGFEQIVWSELFGDGTVSDAPISRTEAMAVAAFARARNVLCATAGRLPLEVFTAAGDPVPGRTCVTQPEPGRARFTTMLWTVDQMLCHGRAWWVVVERYVEDDRPRAFEWVPEWAGRYDEVGQLVGEESGRTFKPEDVVRIDGPHEGVLNFAGRVLRQAQRLAAAALRAADNPVPSIDLHQTTPDRIEDTEKRALIDGWASARRGANGGVAYTNSAIEAKVLGQPVEQLLIEGR
jgi:hypothetical protein